MTERELAAAHVAQAVLHLRRDFQYDLADQLQKFVLFIEHPQCEITTEYEASIWGDQA